MDPERREDRMEALKMAQDLKCATCEVEMGQEGHQTSGFSMVQHGRYIYI